MSRDTLPRPALAFSGNLLYDNRIICQKGAERMKCRITAVLVLLCLALSGCAGKKEAAFAPEDARRLTVFTAHDQSVYEPLVREFEARTGIWVEVEAGTAEELPDRAGTCDFLFGGSAAQLDAAGAPWFPVSRQPLVLVYNTKLVRQNLPRGWADLTSPAWTGTVAFPSPDSQEGLLALSMLVQTGGSLDALAKNLDGSLLADSRLVVSSVAEGSFYIGIALEETALSAMEAGFDIAVVTPAEGTAALTDGAAVIPGCAHETNAEAFAAFLQGGDVRRMLKSQLHRRPAREQFEELTVCPEEILTQWQAIWKEACP